MADYIMDNARMQDARTLLMTRRGAVPRRGSAEARPGLNLAVGETTSGRGSRKGAGVVVTWGIRWGGVAVATWCAFLRTRGRKPYGHTARTRA